MTQQLFSLLLSIFIAVWASELHDIRFTIYFRRPSQAMDQRWEQFLFADSLFCNCIHLRETKEIFLKSEIFWLFLGKRRLLNVI